MQENIRRKRDRLRRRVVAPLGDRDLTGVHPRCTSADLMMAVTASPDLSPSCSAEARKINDTNSRAVLSRADRRRIGRADLYRNEHGREQRAPGLFIPQLPGEKAEECQRTPGGTDGQRWWCCGFRRCPRFSASSSGSPRQERVRCCPSCRASPRRHQQSSCWHCDSRRLGLGAPARRR